MTENKRKLKVTALAIISIMLFSGITPFLSKSVYDLKPNESNGVIEDAEEYLYLSELLLHQFFLQWHTILL